MQHCLLHAPCHTHSLKASEWPRKRNSFSFEKKFCNFEDNFVWRIPCFRLSYVHCRPKLDEFATLIEMPFSFKKDAITAMTASPSLDPDFCDPFNEANYFSVCNCIIIVLPNIVCFRNFAFRLLKSSIALIYSTCRKSDPEGPKHPTKKVPKRQLRMLDSNASRLSEIFVSLSHWVIAAFNIERLGFI